MRRTAVVAVVVVAVVHVRGMADTAPRGARSSGLGGLSTALTGDLWSATLNPALGSTLSGCRLALEASPAPFGLSELARAGLAAQVNTAALALTACITASGTSHFRETWLASGCSVPIGRGASVGLSVTAQHVRIDAYGSATGFALTIGVSAEPADRVMIGAAVTNAAATPLGHSGERAERTVQLGITATPLEGACVGLDVWKTARFPAEIHAGVEYAIITGLTVRAGISQHPPALSFGAGLRIGPCCLDYAAMFHPLLGPSHLVGVVLCVSSH